MVLRRLSGLTQNAAPVLTLVTQFGGGKTHTLTALYPLVKNGDKAKGYTGIGELAKETGLAHLPEGRVAVFVGNAWDPQPGRETPWIDIARQVAGDKGVALLGTAATEAKARDHLKRRFAECYPFHPATLSVFQRKWQALPQYQQTRGTLAMLAQWISCAYHDGYHNARKEPLITLGSAPLEVSEFRSAVLGRLGESRLIAAIDADISGINSHSRVLDADTKGKGPLADIHRRVATTILFESSGGQVDKVAHLPELRFALGEPDLDTASIDSADIQDSPRPTIVVADPDLEWSGAGSVRQQAAEWTKLRGKSPRLYPGAIVWCIKKPGDVICARKLSSGWPGGRWKRIPEAGY